MSSVTLTRPAVLPHGAAAYRTIGPFDGFSLPAGLLQTHHLKDGVWGVLRLEAGEVAFVWEEGDHERIALAAPAEIVVPPKIPHHLEVESDFSLTIEFYRP